MISWIKRVLLVAFQTRRSNIMDAVSKDSSEMIVLYNAFTKSTLDTRNALIKYNQEWACILFKCSLCESVHVKIHSWSLSPSGSLPCTNAEADLAGRKFHEPRRKIHAMRTKHSQQEVSIFVVPTHWKGVKGVLSWTR